MTTQLISTIAGERIAYAAGCGKHRSIPYMDAHPRAGVTRSQDIRGSDNVVAPHVKYACV